MTLTMRLTYRNAMGEVHTEDLIGGSSWRKADYQAAIRRQRPQITVVRLEAVARRLELDPPQGHRAFCVVLKVPGRPSTRLFLEHCTGYADARRRALCAAEAGARLVWCSEMRDGIHG